MTIGSIFNALLFVAIGIIVFAFSLVIVGKVLPGDLWKAALLEKNREAALLLAAIALALGWIVAAAVH